jgi:hypothetical protein
MLVHRADSSRRSQAKAEAQRMRILMNIPLGFHHHIWLTRLNSPRQIHKQLSNRILR